MKKLMTILYFFLPISLFAQSLNENPYLTYYLGTNLQESSLGTIMGRTYDGIGKIELSKHIPSSWINSYSLNHLPITARHSDFITPFGRSYMSVGVGSNNRTAITFLGSTIGEMDASLLGKYSIDKKKKLLTSVSLNYHHYQGNLDKNNDNFLDLNQKQKFIGINHWSYKNKNYSATLSAYHLNSDETGGEVQFDKENDYLTQNAYGLGTKVSHTGIGIQNQWIFKDQETNIQKGMLFLDAETRLTDMTKFYGLNEYKAKEQTINAYLGYKIQKGFTDWEMGLHFRNENLEESFADSQFTNSNIYIPGAYARMETQLGYRFKLQTDIRANYHSDDQFLVHPGLKITYVPADKMAFSVFAGNGTRYARIFTENERFLFSNREVSISEKLNPEKAWHYGFSYRWNQDKWTELLYNWNVGGFNYYMLFYHNIYQNQNIADISNPNLLVFRNHTGKSSKTSLNNRIIFSPYKSTFVTLMHRFDVYKTDETGILTNHLYAPRNSFMFSLTYRFKKYAYFNTQVHIVGKTAASTEAYADGFAPKRKRWDMSITLPIKPYINNFKTFKKFDLIIGFDNVTNHKLDEVVLGNENPFSQEMDGGITNGSAMGSRIYGGLKVEF